MDVPTDFRPTTHGFHFPNQFENHLLKTPLFDLTTRGRCGGMAYAALDYFYAGIPVPSYTPDMFYPKQVPPDGNLLADYIYKREWDSIWDGFWKFGIWTVKPDSFLGSGVGEITRNIEIPKLCARLDSGKPVALGLIATPFSFNFTKHHQVVAYAYKNDVHQPGKIRISLYDPNFPNCNDVILVPDLSGMGTHLLEMAGDWKVAEWRGLFVQGYVPKIPCILS